MTTPDVLSAAQVCGQSGPRDVAKYIQLATPLGPLCDSQVMTFRHDHISQNQQTLHAGFRPYHMPWDTTCEVFLHLCRLVWTAYFWLHQGRGAVTPTFL